MSSFPRLKDIAMMAPPSRNGAEQIAKMAQLTEDDLRERLSYAEADARSILTQFTEANAMVSSTLDGAEALLLLVTFRELAPPGSKLRDALSFAHSTLSALAVYPDHACGAFDLGADPKDVIVERMYERVVDEDVAEKLSPGIVHSVRKTEACVLKIDPERVGVICRLRVYTQQSFQGAEKWTSAGLLLSTIVDGKVVHAGYCSGSGITEALSDEFLDWPSTRPKTVVWWEGADVKEATP